MPHPIIPPALRLPLLLAGLAFTDHQASATTLTNPSLFAPNYSSNAKVTQSAVGATSAATLDALTEFWVVHDFTGFADGSNDLAFSSGDMPGIRFDFSGGIHPTTGNELTNTTFTTSDASAIRIQSNTTTATTISGLIDFTGAQVNAAAFTLAGNRFDRVATITVSFLSRDSANPTALSTQTYVGTGSPSTNGLYFGYAADPGRGIGGILIEIELNSGSTTSIFGLDDVGFSLTDPLLFEPEYSTNPKITWSAATATAAPAIDALDGFRVVRDFTGFADGSNDLSFSSKDMPGIRFEFSGGIHPTTGNELTNTTFTTSGASAIRIQSNTTTATTISGLIDFTGAPVNAAAFTLAGNRFGRVATIKVTFRSEDSANPTVLSTQTYNGTGSTSTNGLYFGYAAAPGRGIGGILIEIELNSGSTTSIFGLDDMGFSPMTAHRVPVTARWRDDGAWADSPSVITNHSDDGEAGARVVSQGFAQLFLSLPALEIGAVYRVRLDAELSGQIETVSVRVRKRAQPYTLFGSRDFVNEDNQLASELQLRTPASTQADEFGLYLVVTGAGVLDIARATLERLPGFDIPEDPVGPRGQLLANPGFALLDAGWALQNAHVGTTPSSGNHLLLEPQAGSRAVALQLEPVTLRIGQSYEIEVVGQNLAGLQTRLRGAGGGRYTASRWTPGRTVAGPHGSRSLRPTPGSSN